MTRQTRLAWSLVGLCVAFGAVHTWLIVGWSAARKDPSGWPILTVGVVLGAALGALIVTRRPGHRVGWIFLIGGLDLRAEQEAATLALEQLRLLVHGMGPDPGQRAAVNQAAVSRSGPKADFVT